MKWVEIIAVWLYVLVTSIEARFNELNQIKCHRCGCRDRRSINHHYLHPEYNGVILEFDEACTECGVITNSWAHGSFNFPTTYTEELGLWWFLVKSNVKHFFRWRVFK